MGFKSVKYLLLIILVMGLALVSTGCGGQSADDPNTIKIGLMAPLTGDVKTFGESAVNGAKMAVDERNGKIGNFNIELITADDRNDATEAVNVATKLISQDKVSAIVGSVTSKTTIPVTKMANDSKVVIITGTGTSAKVTVDEGVRKEYAFRACFIDPFQGKVAAKFAIDNLGKKTAAVLYDQSNDYTIGLADNFKQAFTAGGGQITDYLAYGKDDTDFNAVLSNVAAKNPDILYLPDYYQKVSLIGKQARDKGIKAIFLGGDGWDSAELDYKTMEGGYFTNHYSSDDPNPRIQKFIADYTAKYNKAPDAFAVLSYDAASMLLNSIEKANSKDPAAIRDALQNISGFETVSGGKMTFDKDGNPIKPAVILQIKGGKQTFVTTVAP